MMNDKLIVAQYLTDRNILNRTVGDNKCESENLYRKKRTQSQCEMMSFFKNYL